MHILDARGLKCPEPLMLLHNKIAQMQAGERVQLRATDDATLRDVERFCEFLGHVLVSSTCVQGVYELVVEKTPKQET